MGRYIKYEIKGSYKFILGVLALILILTTGIYMYANKTDGGSALGGNIYRSIYFSYIWNIINYIFIYSRFL